MKMDFYRAFEEKYRGPRKEIKLRLQAYLPFISAIKNIYLQPTAVDLGCGRGEWLELLAEYGFDAQGVDVDNGMLEASRELGLNVHTGDAISFLKNLPNESQAIISGFHLAEHIAFDDLRVLVEEALRSLKPAGLLILETPNPENIVVGTSKFYLDPTHTRPLPPLLLSFLPEYYEFERVKILRLTESKSISENTHMSLTDIFHGVSPDYAVVAQKSAAQELIAEANTAFDLEYGVTLEQVTMIYEQQTEATNNRVEGVAGTLIKLEGETLAAHESAIKEEQAHIDSLQTALKMSAESQDKLFNEKNKALAAYESIIKEQQAHVDSLQAVLKMSAESQNTLLNEKAQALAAHESIIEEQKAHVDTLQTALKKFAESQDNLLNEKAQLLAARESVIEEQRVHASTLQAALKISNGRVEELTNEVTLAKSFAEELNEKLKEKDKVLTDCEYALAEQGMQSQRLQNEWEAAEAKIAELNASSHHWWTMAGHLTNELQAVYHSKSWRLTRLLREMNRILTDWPHRVRSRLKLLALKPSIYLDLGIRKVLEMMLSITKRNPKLMFLRLKYVDRYPSLKSFLRRYIIPGGGVVQSPAPVMLSPAARKIYLQLKNCQSNTNKRAS